MDNELESKQPLTPSEKVRTFPTQPGVYLMKDAQARVIYVGKAKNLRNRAGSYFHKQAQFDSRIAGLISEIADIDFICVDSEVDALLLEARLIKDIRPRFNSDLKDDKTYPYLQIRVREDFPRVEFTRKPRRGAKLYGPFTSARSLRAAIQVLQRIFQFRTCKLDINEGDEQWRWFRPCLLYNIRQCNAPCNMRVSKEQYREQIRRLQMVLDGKKDGLIQELQETMKRAAVELDFERAGKLRDQIQALGNLKLRGEVDKDVQPEVFVLDPKRGVRGLQKILKLEALPRVIEGIDIAHFQGSETVASLVQFVDGVPFKPGYRRFRIQSVNGVDDFASIREVVTRRYRRLQTDEELFPDVIMIDGGKGQLHAAHDALRHLRITQPCLISLAKREEEIYQLGQSESLKLSRNAAALRLLQYIRDEAHRFAQQYHKLLRHKKLSDGYDEIVEQS
ncbi:MAG: excinuclease ABC subunit UvrC [Planctomycetia bacterium]|nr:excinuclease ABC subunit UvrC [Planctomycetia bacterium]